MCTCSCTLNSTPQAQSPAGQHGMELASLGRGYYHSRAIFQQEMRLHSWYWRAVGDASLCCSMRALPKSRNPPEAKIKWLAEPWSNFSCV